MARKIYGLGDNPGLTFLHWLGVSAILYTLFGWLHVLPFDYFTFTIALMVADFGIHNLLGID